MEHPILFSAPMVRAILDGKKTETRRVVKPQPERHYWETLPGYKFYAKITSTADGTCVKYIHTIPQNPCGDEPVWIKCPYGSPGDILWVRESWCSVPDTMNLLTYAADDIPHGQPYNNRPSIHMSREQSRITLEVVNVKVERLQDMLIENAIKEGFISIEEFKELWNIIHKKDGFTWDKNPWVWVIQFKRIAL